MASSLWAVMRQEPAGQHGEMSGQQWGVRSGAQERVWA